VSGQGPARPVLLDCDPGHDDALAMLLALQRPELELLGVSTVAGNSTLENTTRNALAVLTLLGRDDVPVAAGADAPLARPLVTAPNVHGGSGLAGALLPQPHARAIADHASDFMAETVARNPRPVTLVATGPLTNVALFRRRHPEAFSRLAAICLMGGSMGEGNVTPQAEFNIWVDPEAAREVFASGVPLTMIGLDVTHQALLTLHDADRISAIGNQSGRVFADLLRFFARFHQQRYGWDGAPIHDAVAVAHVLGLGMVTTEPRHVEIDVGSGSSRGRTIVAAPSATALPNNADVGVTIDGRRFVELLVDAVAAAP
jgi:pyrimidine-specific ribonucleoside hydrolase